MDRLDKIISEKLKLPRSKVKRIIEEGYVFLNNEKILKTNIKIDEEKNNIKIDKEYKKLFENESKEEILKETLEKVKILYEDEYIYIIDKPYGIITESKTTKENTLVDILRRKGFKLSKGEDDSRDGIVHRLDKDTSGVLIITKTEEANKKFMQIFKERKIEKTYRCIVKGIPVKDSAYIDMPIKRDKKNRTKMKVASDGKKALTKFIVIKRYKDVSDLRVNIYTGRTHQIRLHMSEINHPILGDDKYGLRKNRYNVKRQMLHSEALKFIHPFTNEELKITSDIPDDYKKLLERLEE